MKDIKIREPILAGTWYPEQAETLRRDIRSYLDAAKPPSIEGEIKGVVVPHAGYFYSGAVAAYAYKLLEKKSFQRVIVMAPSHRAAFRGVSIGPMEGYRTPLGVVPVDKDMVERLRAGSPLVKYHPGAEAREHSLEIQLPFLQVVLDNFKLIPLIMGDSSFSLCEEIATLLYELCRNDSVLLAASTDLSHFHTYEEAKVLDDIVLKKVEAFDPQGLHQNLRDRHCEACGAGPMVTLMMATRKLDADGAKVLHYANSGDVTGDKKSVVGYMAAAIYKSQKPSKVSMNPAENSSSNSNVHPKGASLTEDEKAALRKSAMESIRNHCLGTPVPTSSPPLTASLSEHRGAFVTLHKGQNLRGCIGMIEASQPLDQTVRRMAVQAAFNDPRFTPLSPAELDEIDIEISVLTPLKRVTDVETIRVGEHGLYIRKGNRAGILLPQVATEQGWNRTEFIEQTCRKAGLPADSWEDKETEIYAFSADIF